jgi:tripartite-type tricarboxylate transporter receptor subunit TctC
MHIRRITRGRLALLISAMLFLPITSLAQDYPQRPIRLIVGFPPGGTTDIVARIMASKMSERLNQQVVVDNRPGASGLIGGSIVGKSQPDGYTLFITGASAAITVSLYAKPPYDITKDLMPIAYAASTPYVVVTHPSINVKTLQELVAYARANPGKLQYGASSPGTTQHLTGESIKRYFGFDMLYVPYKGTGPMLPDVLAGRLQVAIDNVLALLPHIKGGAFRPLAVTTAKRTAMLPDVPTIAESGMPGFDASGWFGFFAALKTPQPIRDKLAQAIIAIMQDADTRAQMLKIGADPIYGGPEDLNKILHNNVATWGKVIREAGLKVE